MDAPTPPKPRKAAPKKLASKRQRKHKVVEAIGMARDAVLAAAAAYRVIKPMVKKAIGKKKK